jgi:hypothetical protein
MEKTYWLTIDANQLKVIEQGLANLPFGQVVHLWNNLMQQIAAQDKELERSNSNGTLKEVDKV